MGLLQYVSIFLLISQTITEEIESMGNKTAKAFVEHKLVPDLLDEAPNNFAEVVYSDKVRVCLGNKLAISSVLPTPSVSWEADPNRYYTLVMVDPDTPLVGGVKHWLVGNIPGNDISKGLTLAPYLNPITPPGTGLHRYTFLVFCQPSLLKFNENIVISTADRFFFSVSEFARKYKLSLFAGNFFKTNIIL